MNVLANNIATKVANLSDPSVRKLEVNLYGIAGKSSTEVFDIVVRTSKERFNEFGGEDTLWQQLEKPNHRRTLETKITHYLRQHDCDYDCAFIYTEEKIMTLSFRISAELSTQHPQNFAPLYLGDIKDIVELKQGEHAITHANAEKPVLATWHLAECVALIGYDEKEKIGVLAHIDTCADIKDFFVQLKRPYHFYLLGGNEGNHRESILEEAKKAKFIFGGFLDEKLNGKDIEKDCIWTISMRLRRSIAIDTRTGEIYSYDPAINDGSSLHKRKFTTFEAQKFEWRREAERKLNLVYVGQNGLGGH